MIKGNLAIIINHLFQTLLVTYLLLLLAEQVWQGTVSVYINLNYLLIMVIITGILDVFSEKPNFFREKPTTKDFIFVILLGIIGFAIIKFKTQELGLLSWIIATVAGILIILLSLLVLEDSPHEK